MAGSFNGLIGKFNQFWGIAPSLSMNTQTASYQAVLADANTNLVQMNAAGANNFTVPANATVAFGIGDQLLIAQIGAGQTTIVAAGGVTINTSSATLKLRAQYSEAALIKTGTNTWLLIGDLAGS